MEFGNKVVYKIIIRKREEVTSMWRWEIQRTGLGTDRKIILKFFLKGKILRDGLDPSGSE
jgi:hypothetical protein